MKRHHQTKGQRHTPQGPSQRQLRAGELEAYALVEVLREEELQDEAMAGVSVTVTEVRMSPDLRHAHVFVEPLGGSKMGAAQVHDVIKALIRHAKFLRGRLGHGIDMKFTPELKFQHDETFDEAERMARLFADPKVRGDLEKADDDEDEDHGA